MRLTGMILLVFCLQVSARSGAQQRITINVKDVSLQKLFSEIEKKGNYTFFYDVTMLKETKPVTVAVKEATVEEILKQALVGQALEYTIMDKTIFVKKETEKGAITNATGKVEASAVPTDGVSTMVIIQVDFADARRPPNVAIEFLLLCNLVIGSFILTIYMHARKKSLHRWLGRAGVIIDIMGALGFLYDIYELFKLLWGK
jgi:hypothetical protein